MSNLDLQNNILNILILFGGLQGLILSTVVLFYPDRDKASNNLLAIFIFTAVILLLAPILQIQLGWKYVWIFHCTKFITISSLYLYIRSLSEEVSLKRTLKHFSFAFAYIPIALHYVKYIQDKYQVTYEYAGGQDTYDQVLSFTNLIYIVFYVFLYFKAYRQHKARVQQNFSSEQKLGINWIKQLIFGFLGTVIISYTLLAYVLAYPDFSTKGCLLNMVALTIFLYFVTIKGKISPEIYKLRKIVTETSEADAQTLKEASKNDPNGEQKSINPQLMSIAEKVKETMKDEEFFRNENVSIKELSETIGFQSYLVSQAINSVMGKTFFELINEERVNVAKRLLTDEKYDHLSLVGIGFESGFNSKTTFNTTFKKHTGMTPSEYKKSKQLV
ncbi:helix-turn-helix domain-containing protein [Pararhodonellum marinum]|uniref:helix-turn-helix domain-containing protein n=1 Tax=Pararhodonellum marinum TaxID=2755358 RepID=UPI00189079C6|nr:helix-turn-helix domain-containing protein [Pararhodonellum marinum]